MSVSSAGSGGRHALAMDVGGTNVRAAVVDVSTGTIVSRCKVQHSGGTSLAEVTERLAQAARAAAKQAGVSMDSFEFAGLGFPGPCQDGVALQAANLGWTEATPIGASLEKALGIPIHLENDLKAAARGEDEFGAARNVDSSLLVFVGSGVGMAYVKDGKPDAGSHGVAGEWGHTSLVGLPASKKRSCGCGRANCIEAFVGGKSIGKRVVEDLEKGAKSSVYELALARLKSDEKQPLEGLTPTEQQQRVLSAINAGTVEEAVKLEDPYAIQLWEELGELLGASIANLATTFDPGKIVLGGGVLLNCPSLVSEVKKAFSEALLFTEQHQDLLTMAELGDDAGTVGAAVLGNR